jgi:hypothetical protein
MESPTDAWMRCSNAAPWYTRWDNLLYHCMCERSKIRERLSTVPRARLIF